MNDSEANAAGTITQTKPLSEPWRTLKRLGPVGVLAVIAGALPAVGGILLLTYSQTVAEWLRGHGEGALPIYIVGFTLLAGLAVLPTYAQAVLGGFVFHFAVGFPSAMAGFGGAALIGYAIARLASGDRAQKLIDEHPKWRAVEDALIGGGFWKTLGIVTLLRLPPNSPFAACNLVMAATRVPFGIYLLGTVIGMAPRTAAAVYIGATIQDMSQANARSGWTIAFAIATALIVLAVIGHIANKALARFTNSEPVPAEVPRGEA